MPKINPRRAIDLGGNKITASSFVPSTRVVQSPSAPAEIDEAALAEYVGNVLIGGYKARKHRGIQTWLASSLVANNTFMITTAPVFSNGQRCVLHHYDNNPEKINVLSEPTSLGSTYRYSISRSIPENTYPAWETEVVGIGSQYAGGYLYEAGGDESDFPWLEWWSVDAGGNENWRIRAGRLSTVPESFKTQWSDIDLGPDFDFDEEFGVAVNDDIFVDGVLAGRNLLVRNNANINHRLQVKTSATNAIQQMGQTISGYGIVAPSDSGNPLFSTGIPLEDIDAFFFRLAAENGTPVIDFTTRYGIDGYEIKVGEVIYSDKFTKHVGSDGMEGHKISWFNRTPVPQQSVDGYELEATVRQILWALEAYGLIRVVKLEF